MRRRLLMLSPLILLAFVGFVALGGWVVSLLWNWLLPPLFGWPAIGFWQALGLLALSRILFGGLSMHGGRRMSTEERERFRQGMRRRFGFGPPNGGTGSGTEGAPSPT